MPLLPLLDDDQPLYGLEAPGFEDEDEKPLTTVAELADAHLKAINDNTPSGPVYLLGWSMGGVIGYHMAQRLRAAGVDVPMLITVDTPVPVPWPFPARRPMVRRFAGDLTGAALLSDQHVLDDFLAARSEDEPIEDTFAALTDAGLIPVELDPESLAQRYAVFHANIVALHVYSPTAGYPGPMVNIHASQSAPDEAMGDWSTFSANVTTHVVPGDHYTIWQGEGLIALAAVIRDALS
jgi:thioesterase domain-containing protein